MPLVGINENKILQSVSICASYFRTHACYVIKIFSSCSHMFTGATMVLRVKFSASHYFDDCRRHGVTIAQYIGELARYLMHLPEVFFS